MHPPPGTRTSHRGSCRWRWRQRRRSAVRASAHSPGSCPDFLPRRCSSCRPRRRPCLLDHPRRRPRHPYPSCRPSRLGRPSRRRHPIRHHRPFRRCLRCRRCRPYRRCRRSHPRRRPCPTRPRRRPTASTARDGPAGAAAPVWVPATGGAAADGNEHESDAQQTQQSSHRARRRGKRHAGKTCDVRAPRRASCFRSLRGTGRHDQVGSEFKAQIQLVQRPIRSRRRSE